MPRGKRVTLTFDNGPTPGVTDEVLDILAERSLRAIFFVVANRVVIADFAASQEFERVQRGFVKGRGHRRLLSLKGNSRTMRELQMRVRR